VILSKDGKYLIITLEKPIEKIFDDEESEYYDSEEEQKGNKEE
jgi:hypothetical protein